MWNDFDFSLNVNFDLPLVDTKGLPRLNSSNSSDSTTTNSNGNRGETKNGRGGGGGGYSAGKYLSEGACIANGSTVVDISIPPPSFKPAS